MYSGRANAKPIKQSRNTPQGTRSVKRFPPGECESKTTTRDTEVFSTGISLSSPVGLRNLWMLAACRRRASWARAAQAEHLCFLLGIVVPQSRHLPSGRRFGD